MRRAEGRHGGRGAVVHREEMEEALVALYLILCAQNLSVVFQALSIPVCDTV